MSEKGTGPGVKGLVALKKKLQNESTAYFYDDSIYCVILKKTSGGNVCLLQVVVPAADARRRVNCCVDVTELTDGR